MNNFEYNQKEETSSFEIHKKSHSKTEFYFAGKDHRFGFDGKADLFINPAPIFLNDILSVSEEILICQNVKFNRQMFLPNVLERLFVKMISKALGELYRFSIFHRLPGTLILLSQEEIIPLTELQKNWLKDFYELFTFIELTTKGIHQLYMPTNLKSFQHYCELHTLLEQSISSTQKGENK